MSTKLTDELADLSIQQVSRRTGLAESALRYYERIGLIEPVPRDQSSGHRRYPRDLVAAIEALSCLRGTGMSVADMRAYVANMQRGHAGEAELWAAKERGDAAAEKRSIPQVQQLSARLLAEEVELQHD